MILEESVFSIPEVLVQEAGRIARCYIGYGAVGARHCKLSLQTTESLSWLPITSATDGTTFLNLITKLNNMCCSSADIKNSICTIAYIPAKHDEYKDVVS